MLIDSLIAKKVWVKSYVTGQIALLPKPMIMKGTIAVAGDFPTTAEVLNGWVYKVTANVTDNNPAKTNTGLSFLAGDEICWIEELDTWVDLGSDALFVRDDATDTLSPANANDNLDLGSGDFITTGDVDAGTHSSLTLTPLATGFSVAGGTAPKTLTVSNDADVSGTNTGDASGHTGLVPYTGATGAVNLGSQTLSSGGLTTKGDSNLYSNSTDANVKDIKLYKSRGTFASPSTILTSDYLGEIVALGHDGSVTDYGHGAGYVRSASIRFKSSGTIGVNRVPSQIEFWTSTDASPSVETLRGSISVFGDLSFSNYVTSGVFLNNRGTIGTTSSIGMRLQNSTASTVGVPVQMSTRFQESGSAWNTTSSASETVDCIQELLPVSGTSVSGTYRIGFSINGGAYSYPFTFTSGGNLTVSGNMTVQTMLVADGGYGIGNATSILRGFLGVGSNISGNFINRNIADAFATLTINNFHASSTGNITNFQWQSVNQVTIGRTGTVSISSAQAIANVSTDGLVLENTSPALVGTPVQMSERTRYSGRAWETTGGTSQSVDCISELLPVSGATASGIYRIGFSINGGAYSYPFTISSGGILDGLNAIRPVNIYGVSANHLTLYCGTSTASAQWSRNTADAYATAVFNNLNAGSTGNITNFQWQSVNRLSIQKEGHISAPHADGVKIGIATSEKLGFWNATPVVQQVLAAYTTDNESAAYTGIDNAQAGSVYAQLTDLNALRVAYETLRASYDDLRTKLNTIGIVGV